MQQAAGFNSVLPSLNVAHERGEIRGITVNLEKPVLCSTYSSLFPTGIRMQPAT